MAWNPTDGWKPEEEISGSSWTCAGTSGGDGCSIGDYQYGAFIDILDKCTHRFFVPFGVRNPPYTASKTHGALVSSFISDSVPPTGSISINSNAVYTNTPAVTLGISATDDKCAVTQMCIANGTNPQACVLTGWEPYQKSKPWTLPGGDGSYSVLAWFRDSSGNTSTMAQDGIVLDTTSPAGSFVLATGKTYSCTSPVSFDVVCNDNLSGCSQVRYRVLPEGACGLPGYPVCPRFSNWEPFGTWSPSKAITMTATPATASYSTVEVQYNDAAGNLSNISAAQLLMGRAPNPPALTAPANGATSVSVTPTLSWSSQFGTDFYDVQVCSDAACSSIVWSVLSISATKVTVSTTLAKNTTYSWRVRARNGCGTPAWGTPRSFTTLANLPTVMTEKITVQSVSSASGGGTVATDGGAPVSSRGVCWSTTPNPTLADSLTADGAGLGTFTSSLTGLTPNVTYNVRAYATNSGGTAYGTNLSFSISPVAALLSGAATTLYLTPGEAYLDATNGDIIKFTADTFNGNQPNLSRGIKVTLKGGDEPTFTTQVGSSAFFSPFIIGTGQAILDRIVIK